MNIYVANLSYRIQDENLREIFAEYGTVNSAKVIKDHFSGKSRGFGFVEMPNDEEAQKAIENLDNAKWDGTTITVNKARPKEDSGNGNSTGRSNNFNNKRNNRY